MARGRSRRLPNTCLPAPARQRSEPACSRIHGALGALTVPFHYRCLTAARFACCIPRGLAQGMRQDFCASVIRRAALAAFVSCGAACSVHPIVPPTARPLAATPSESLTLILLRPVVRIDKMPPADAPLSFAPNQSVPPASDGEPLIRSLYDAAKGAAAALQPALIDCQTAEDGDAGLCKQLDPLVGRLAHGSTTADGRSVLHHVAEVQPNCAVLATQLDVELGPGAYYNSATGQMGSAMSTSAFRAALTRCDTAEVLWKNEVLLRAVPDLDS